MVQTTKVSHSCRNSSAENGLFRSLTRIFNWLGSRWNPPDSVFSERLPRNMSQQPATREKSRVSAIAIEKLIKVAVDLQRTKVLSVVSENEPGNCRGYLYRPCSECRHKKIPLKVPWNWFLPRHDEVINYRRWFVMSSNEWWCGPSLHASAGTNCTPRRNTWGLRCASLHVASLSEMCKDN